jgi:hypothetical protein
VQRLSVAAVPLFERCWHDIHADHWYTAAQCNVNATAVTQKRITISVLLPKKDKSSGLKPAWANLVAAVVKDPAGLPFSKCLCVYAPWLFQVIVYATSFEHTLL